MNFSLKTEIETRLLKQKMGIAELEKKANLKRNAVRNILTGRSKNPNVETMKAIAACLGCYIEDLLQSNESNRNSGDHLRVLDFKLFYDSVAVVIKILEDKNYSPPIEKYLRG